MHARDIETIEKVNSQWPYAEFRLPKKTMRVREITFTKGCSMKEFIIDSCKWYIYEDMNSASQLDAIKEFKSRYEPLLGFLIESKLFKCNLPKSIEDWQCFEMKLSDFTDDGLELVIYCHDRWLDSINKGVNPENISLWKRQLSKLYQDSNQNLH